jgi:fatty-acyl-CoA synthase
VTGGGGAGRERCLARSYAHGASAQPLLGDTIGEALDEVADRAPAAEALVVRHQHVRWTYGELRARADRFAAGLVALGLERGDRVGIWSPNNAEWVVTEFATARAGLILVNINPAYRVHELQYVLTKVGCKALVSATTFRGADYLGMIHEIAPELEAATPAELRSAALPDLRTVIQIGGTPAPGALSFEAVSEMADRTSRERLHARAEGLQFDDPINIQFTSGTTGMPKGATLTHHNLLNNGFFVGEAQRLSEGDRVCIPVPLYHCFGMVLGNLACLTHTAAMVYPSEGFDARAVLETVEAERCTALYGVPTMFIAELDHAEFSRFDLQTLRTGIMAGSPCPVEVMKRVVSDMHMREVTICYGMTETSPVSFQTAPDDPLDRRVSTVGRIHPHVEVKIVDERGNVVAPGVAGELCTRGYSVMLGYWDDEARTAEVVDAAGWMHTGDLATLDAEGYCNIVGRIKDMVIRGGENVYPREIEEFLYSHPKIQDVQVIGVPDRKYGEEICAWIVVKPGATLTTDEVRAFCDGQIARYKIPRYVKLVEGFPLTVTGKVQKYLMREQMKRELGLEDERTA